jgi:hypothetical protein
MLNESYRLRYNQYIKLGVVAISTILLFLFISFLSTMFPYVPSSVFDLLSIIVVSSGLILFYYLYTDMLSRDNTDYNELDLEAPIIGEDVTVGPEREYDNKKLFNVGFCIADTCCAKGTIWDSAQGKCIPNIENFAVSANNPYEFSKYSGI